MRNIQANKGEGLSTEQEVVVSALPRRPATNAMPSCIVCVVFVKMYDTQGCSRDQNNHGIICRTAPIFPSRRHSRRWNPRSAISKRKSWEKISTEPSGPALRQDFATQPAPLQEENTKTEVRPREDEKNAKKKSQERKGEENNNNNNKRHTWHRWLKGYRDAHTGTLRAFGRDVLQ